MRNEPCTNIYRLLDTVLAATRECLGEVCAKCIKNNRTLFKRAYLKIKLFKINAPPPSPTYSFSKCTGAFEQYNIVVTLKYFQFTGMSTL
jgi:hypothetical protein